jgi:hypothetical protein
LRWLFNLTSKKDIDKRPTTACPGFPGADAALTAEGQSDEANGHDDGGRISPSWPPLFFANASLRVATGAPAVPRDWNASSAICATAVFPGAIGFGANAHRPIVGNLYGTAV